MSWEFPSCWVWVLLERKSCVTSCVSPLRLRGWISNVGFEKKGGVLRGGGARVRDRRGRSQICFFPAVSSLAHRLQMPASPSELSFLFWTQILLGSIAWSSARNSHRDYQHSGQHWVQTGRARGAGKHVVCSEVCPPLCSSLARSTTILLLSCAANTHRLHRWFTSRGKTDPQQLHIDWLAELTTGFPEWNFFFGQTERNCRSDKMLLLVANSHLLTPATAAVVDHWSLLPSDTRLEHNPRKPDDSQSWDKLQWSILTPGRLDWVSWRTGAATYKLPFIQFIALL